MNLTNYDYNATPMAPPGTKIVVHDKSTTRKSWAPHGTDGWYIGPSLHHYRCVKCFMPTTKSVRDADTVVFLPETIPFPETSADEHLKQAATDIIRILTKKQRKTHFPSLEMGDKTRNALLKIAKILNKDEPLPPLEPPTVKTVTFSPDTKTTSTHRVLRRPSSSPTSTVLPSPPPSSSSTTPTVTTPSPPSSTLAATPPKPTVQPTAAPTRVLQPKKIVAAPRVPKGKGKHLTQSSSRAKNKKLLKQLKKAIKAVQQKYQSPTSLPQRKSTRKRTPSSRYTKGYATASTRLLAQHLYEQNSHHFTNNSCPMVNHIYDDNGKRLKIHDLMSDPKTTEVWTRAMSNELGRLAQSNKYGVKSTDTIQFIPRSEVPKNRDVTYANFILDFRPLKSEPNRLD